MNSESGSATEETAGKKGIFSRHPRLGIIIIGALFILPLCAMMITVAVIILMQIQNAQ